MLITTTVATEIAALKERLKMAFIFVPAHRPSSAIAAHCPSSHVATNRKIMWADTNAVPKRTAAEQQVMLRTGRYSWRFLELDVTSERAHIIATHP